MVHSKKDIKALLSWHQKSTPHSGNSFYTNHGANSTDLKDDDRINLTKLASESSEPPLLESRAHKLPPNVKLSSESADFSIVPSFTSCDGNWVKDKVRNLRFEKQKIHVRKKLAVAPEPPSEEELLRDLKGYNGQWRKQKAEEAWPEHIERVENIKKQEAEREQKKEQRRLMKEFKIKEHVAKIKGARLLKEERERQAEVQRALRDALEEEERQKKQADEEEARRKQNHRTPCGACSGSGICAACNGKGLFVSLFLSSSVTARSCMFHGRTARGCEDCGGLSEYTATGKLRKGKGKCSTCGGTGDVAENDSPGKKSGMNFQTGRLGWAPGLMGSTSPRNMQKQKTPSFAGSERPSFAGSERHL